MDINLSRRSALKLSLLLATPLSGGLTGFILPSPARAQGMSPAMAEYRRRLRDYTEAREAFERIYFEQLLGREQSNMSRVAEKAGQLPPTGLFELGGKWPSDRAGGREPAA